MSNRLKQYGVGEWMVAQIVIPLFTSDFTTVMTCTRASALAVALQCIRLTLRLEVMLTWQPTAANSLHDQAKARRSNVFTAQGL